MAPQAGRTTLHVVAHTHWDREWYEPFQSFRLKLVDTLDELLDMLDTEAGLRFLLDGQTAMVDDYLDVRPEREADIRRHAAAGRLTLGPLSALPDELLVSGETLVRNIQRGLRRAAELGEPMPVGYLPDMFGHTAQMPQILTLAGLDRAVVWRGVPARVDRTLFRWRGLDGSEVLATYLSASYSNAVALPLDAAALTSRAQALVDEQAPFAPPGHVLAMCGTDHWPAQHGLAAALASLPSNGVEVRLSSLTDYFEAVADELDAASLPVVEGEMRSGIRANVLMGVTSTRVDLKGLQAQAERTLERYAEPLCAVSGTAAPAALFEKAWSHLVLNSAHDSVCSCSSDETMAAVEHRYLEAREIADGLAHRGMRALCDRIHDDRLGAGEHSLVLWNPSPFPRSEVIAVDVPVHWDTTSPEPRPAALEGPDASVHTGVAVEWQSEVMLDLTLTGDQLMGYLPLLRTREFGDVFVNQVDFEASDDLVEIWLRAEPKMRGHLDAEALKSTVVGLVEENPGRSFHVQLVRLPTQRILVRTPQVPPLGWTTLRAVPAAGGATSAAVTWSTDGTDPTLTDGTTSVTFAPDGTFTLADAGSGLSAGGLGRIVDGGDAGDTYNWSPPSLDSVVDVPVAVTITAVDATNAALPRRSVRVERRYLVPAALATGDTARSDDHVALDVTTTVTLTAGDPVVEVVVETDNTARDHRLRMHLPLPAPVTASTAGTAFGVVTRGLAAEGGPQELPLATYPAHRFVDCTGAGAGLSVLCEQVVEYEVCDGAELAVTLVRATGFLSRSAPTRRPNAAGPVLAVRHAQSLGPQRLRLGVRLHDGDGDAAAETVQHAEAFAHPLRTRLVRSNPGGDLPTAGAPVRLAAPPAVALTAFGRDPFSDRPRMRLVNLSNGQSDVSAIPEPWFATQAGTAADARIVDLRGEVSGAAPDGNAALDAWRIATFEW